MFMTFRTVFLASKATPFCLQVFVILSAYRLLHAALKHCLLQACALCLQTAASGASLNWEESLGIHC